MSLVPTRPRTGDAGLRRLTRVAWITTLTIDGSYGSRTSVRSISTTVARERLFDALDGQVIKRAHSSWHVRVYSISEVKGLWWLQLSLEGDPDYTVSMQAALAETGEQTLARLSNWLANPSKTHDALSVV